jgi:competence protein ComEC
MSDRAAVALAAAVAVGAHLGGGPTPVLGGLLVVVALVARRPWLLCFAAAILAAGLADAARAGLDPVDAAEFGPAWVTLVGDPIPLDWGGVRVDVVAGGRRVEAVAHGPPAWALEDRLAGERIAVEGRLRPPPDDAPWLVVRRVVGRLQVDDVVGVAPAAPLAGGANAVRRTLVDGAADLSRTARSLLTGVVLGDDREQPPEVEDDFRAAGLTHLLAVSGQNVAFVLALAGPVLRRLAWRGRLPATLAVIAGFAMLTRLEPSVLRASTMAALACVASAIGRPQEGIRLLALAVAVLLLVDPLLVGSVGFGLSVGASAGILVFAARIDAALRGPRIVREPLAVTLAAQAGALPLLLPIFGSVPVATVPANLLAVPAAGPLMAWGLTGGLAAGVVGDPWRGWLHLPTRLLTGWLASVARVGASLPLGELRPSHAVALAALGAAVVLTRRAPIRRLAGVGMAAVVVSVGVSARAGPPLGETHLADGVELRRRGTEVTVVLSAGARPRDALASLRRAGARCVDAVILAGGGPAVERTAAALGRRCGAATVLQPPLPSAADAGARDPP